MTCTKPATSQPTLENLITRFPSVASDARLTAMTTTAKAHTWAIAGVNARHPHVTGAAATHAGTWTPALGAGRAALLYGALPDLAVTVDDDLPTVLDWPARDGDGALDPAVVTADLVRVHQQQTAAGVAAPIAGCLGSEALRAFPVALSTNVGSNAQRSPWGNAGAGRASIGTTGGRSIAPARARRAGGPGRDVRRVVPPAP